MNEKEELLELVLEAAHEAITELIYNNNTMAAQKRVDAYYRLRANLI